MRSCRARRRAIAAALLVGSACSPAPTPIEATATGPRVVLDADSTSRSFVVHSCYETPSRMSASTLTIDAQARATTRGDIDPWVRLSVEPIREDDEPALVDVRLPSDEPGRLWIERLMDETDFSFVPGDEDTDWPCEDGIAVVTFELVDPSANGRAEIEWDVNVRSSVFTEPEAFDVHVEG